MKFSEQLKKLYKENRSALHVGAIAVIFAGAVFLIVAVNV